MGRLTSDCISKSVGTQNLLRFSLAVNRKYGAHEETLYIDCDLWGDRGPKIAQWMTRGKEVLVEGRLRLDKWEKDGTPQSKIFIVVENLEFVGTAKKVEE